MFFMYSIAKRVEGWDPKIPERTKKALAVTVHLSYVESNNL